MKSKGCKSGNSGGYTLLELMVALAVLLFVVAGIYTAYINMKRGSERQDIQAQLQQNGRNTIDTITRELMVAGYLGKLLTADATTLEFSEQKSGTGPVCIRYSYDSVNRTLERSEKPTSQTGTYTSDQTKTIAEGVEGVIFKYYDVNQADISSNPARVVASPYSTKVRLVTVQVTLKSLRAIPGTTPPQYLYSVYKARLVPKNFAEGEGVVDSVAPAKPTGLRVIDNQDCKSLQVKWNQVTTNIDGTTCNDLAGYLISYGTSTGQYVFSETVALNAISDPKNPQYQLTGPDHSGLQITQYTDRLDTPVKYYVTVQAYDYSINMSDKATEASGPSDLSTDVTSFSQTGNDSVLDPKVPAPPGTFSYYNKTSNNLPAGYAQPGENQILLVWTASQDATVGYRLYRSTTPFASFPISDSLLIADEIPTKGTKLTPSTVSYLDKDPSLVGCRVYYYAICSVNCDGTLIYGNPLDIRYPPKYAAAQYATVTGQSRETTLPQDPDLSSSKGGWKRVFMSVDNKSESDFDHTMLYFGKSPLVMNSDGTVSSTDINNPALLVWDSNATPFSRGVFTNSGIYSFVFNSETRDLGDYAYPELANSTTYYFMAVAFDKCGNHSSGGAKATTLATLCADDPQCPGAPPVPTVTPKIWYNYLDGKDYVELDWNWAPSSVIDLQGYRTYVNNNGNFAVSGQNNDTGSPNATTTYLAGPLWANTYTYVGDPGTQQAAGMDGGTYYYCVRATDCRWENITPDISDYTTTKANNISQPLSSAVVGPIYPGRIIRYSTNITHTPPTGNEVYNFVTTTEIDPATMTETTYRYHNAVKFYIQNTSAGQVNLNQIKLNWTNSAAYLSKIRIGDPNVQYDDYAFATPVAATDAWNGKPLTTTLQNASYKASQAGVYSGAIPVTLIFTNSDGTIDQATDMRGSTIEMDLQYRNEYQGIFTNNPDATSFMDVANNDPINVPYGPSMYYSYIWPGSGSSWVPGFDIPGSVIPAHTVLDDHTVALGGRDIWVYSIVNNSEQYSFYDSVNARYVTMYAGLKDAKLRYGANTQGDTAPPASGSFSDLAANRTWTSDYYVEGEFPSQNGKRVWYHYNYQSTTGNKTRYPENQYGEFMYDQGQFNPCDHTPNAPYSLSYTLSSNKASLTWNSPWQYTDGNSLDQGQDPLKYDVYKKVGYGGSYAVYASNVSWTSYSDPVALSDVTFYKVVAKNSCANPGPKVSDYSNEITICYGAGAGCNIVLNPSTAMKLTSNWGAGGSFSSGSADLRVYVCSKAANGTSNETETITVTDTAGVETSTLTLHEIGDSGIFSLTGTDSGYLNYIYITANSSSYNLSHTDNVIGATKVTAPYNDTVTFSAAGCSSATVSVTTDPCSSAPAPVTNLTASRGTGSNADKVTLSWTAPTANSDGSPFDSPSDLNGYQIIYVKTGGSTQYTTTVGKTTTSTTISGCTITKNSSETWTFMVRPYDTCTNYGTGVTVKK